MITTKAKIMGFLMTSVLVLSAPLGFADNAPNGGNVSGGQPAVSDDQSSSGQGDHEWGHGHWDKHGDHQGGGFFKDLTDDQKKQLKDIWQKQKEAKKAAFEQIKANKEALTNELLQTTPDVNKINDLKSKLEALGAQILDNRIGSDLEVKKILTAEQFAQYLEFQKHKFGRSHKGKWGHSGEGWGHWKHCKHHHRHHHGNSGDQRDGGYGEHQGHGYDNGDNE
jgi:Spy/CpxP family protein refolding chaperone